jgi:transposase InsO family protein
MSKKGDCCDNAAMESWSHNSKVEAVHDERFSALDYVGPEAFEAKKAFRGMHVKTRPRSRLVTY